MAAKGRPCKTPFTQDACFFESCEPSGAVGLINNKEHESFWIADASLQVIYNGLRSHEEDSLALLFLCTESKGDPTKGGLKRFEVLMCEEYV